MAEKPTKKLVDKQSPQPKSSSLFFKGLAVIVALLILIGTGFTAGVYLKLIDVEKLARDLNLAQYPVIAALMPKTNFEPVELAEDDVSVQPETRQSPQSVSAPQSVDDNSNLITQDDLAKQAKLKQQEDAKRISKLARLYGGMKPAEAVSIMQELNDNAVLAILGKMEEEQAAKIIALFDAKRAARLTEDMLKGQVRPLAL